MDWGKILLIAYLVNSRAVTQILIFIFLVIGLLTGWYFAYFKYEDYKISRITPMTLSSEEITGYLIFDVNKDRGFGSDAFLAAARNKPITLVGGTALELFIFDTPTYSDLPDKNMKNAFFAKKKVIYYAPTECVKVIADRNSEIYQDVKKFPGSYCDSTGCSIAIEKSNFNEKVFANHACSKLIELSKSEIGSECSIDLDGKYTYSVMTNTEQACKERSEFIYSFNDGHLKRSIDLERIRFNKKAASNNGRESMISTD